MIFIKAKDNDEAVNIIKMKMRKKSIEFQIEFKTEFNWINHLASDMIGYI